MSHLFFWCIAIILAEGSSIEGPAALSTEEILFVSKLSDQNRYRFCQCFSTKEREETLQQAKDLSPDESVDIIFSHRNTQR